MAKISNDRGRREEEHAIGMARAEARQRRDRGYYVDRLIVPRTAPLAGVPRVEMKLQRDG